MGSTIGDIASKVTEEKCGGCKWFISGYKHGCLNSRLCINYSEWEAKQFKDLCPTVKDFVKQYDKVAKSEWFKKTYQGKSIGETIDIDE